MAKTYLCFEPKILMEVIGDSALIGSGKLNPIHLARGTNEENRKKVIDFCDDNIPKLKRIIRALNTIALSPEQTQSVLDLNDAFVELRAIAESSENVRKSVSRIIVAHTYEAMGIEYDEDEEED